MKLSKKWATIANAAQNEKLVNMFIAWANMTVIFAHFKCEDRGDDDCNWARHMPSGQYNIWRKFPKHIQEAIENYEWPK